MSEPPAVAQEAVAALMEGYLVKQPLHGHALSRPRKRYFVLTEDCLEWFADDKSRHQPPRDRLRVKGAIVQRQGNTLTLHSSHLEEAGRSSSLLSSSRPSQGPASLIVSGERLDGWEAALRSAVQTPGMQQNQVAVAGYLRGQADSRWIDVFCMRMVALRRQDEATRLRESAAERKILFLAKLAHVVPVGLIQSTDFISDLMVIVQLAMMAGGLDAEWKICVVAVVFSLLVAWFWVALVGDFLPARERLTAGVLACANLHVLYVGTRYISALYEGRPIEDVTQLYTLFVMLKMFETGIESVVLGIVTAGAFVRTLVFGGDGLALFASSLALSLLSMAYGFFGTAADAYAEQVAHRRPAVLVCSGAHHRTHIHIPTSQSISSGYASWHHEYLTMPLPTCLV